MQIYVPYPDLKQCVTCLDTDLLHYQVTRDMLNIARKRWPNNELAVAWKNSTFFLCEYAYLAIDELAHRGKFLANAFDKYHEIQIKLIDKGPPSWWGDQTVHAAHRAELLRMNSTHYTQYGWQHSPPGKVLAR